MYHHSQNRELLKDLHKLINDMRKGSIQLLEYQAKQKLKDLLLNPGDAVDHIDHPVDSFCLQGTRQNVLRDIYDWAEDTKSPTICWLPGLAGTGKSTVSRTVARDLRDRCLGGCFFFKKGAGNRAGGRTIFSIIAYQLALNFPPVRQYIIDAVQEDPSSVMRSMNEQWRILIREPLNKVQDKKFITVVLVVDALDECDADDRRNMMALLTECPDVLKVFITSRPEFDIEAHFARHQQLHREIALHRVKMAGSPDSRLDSIIDDSHPVRSAYDATYMPVLDPILNGTPAEAQGKAYDSFTQIIGSLILLANPLSMASLAVLLGVEEHDVAGTVDPLRSVLDVPRDDGPIKLFHLSFRDFLLSKSAGDLKVDENSTHAKLASRCLRHLEGELRTDICDLKSPGRSRFDIDQDTINQKIPQETQYACRYWVHHVIGSGKQLQDNDEEHQFLKRFFLNWIEVLCLTGLFFESPKMLQELLKIVDKTSGSEIFKFVQDAIRFIHFFRDGIEKTPLQLYHSGILFSPSLSIVPQPFEDRRCPESVMRLPAVDSDWPQNVQTFELGRKASSIQLAFLSNNIITTWGFTADVKIWDISSGSCLKTLKDWKDIRSSDRPSTILVIGWSISRVAFSNDGMSLCSISNVATDLESEPVFFIHDLDSGECTSQVPIRNGYDEIFLSTKDWLAVSSSGHQTVIFDLKTGTISHEMDKLTTGSLAISSDAKLLATASEDNIVRVWNLSPQQSTRVGMFHPRDVEFLTITPDGSTVVSACRNQVKTWDVSSGICIETLGESDPMRFRTATEDGSYCVMSSGRNVEVWSRNPWRLFKSLRREEEPPHPNSGPWAISENGELLALPLFHNGMRKTEIWDVYRGLLRQALDFSPPSDSKAVLSPDGSLIAYTNETSIEIRQISESCKFLTRIKDVHPFNLTSLSFHGHKLVGILITGEIMSWDTKTGNLINSCQTGIWCLGKSFINYEVLLGHVGPNVHLRQDVLKELQVSNDNIWITRDDERVLWLPPDYRPYDYRHSGLSAYASGSTIVIGTQSGRVLILCMAD
ncbi:hypothetical protein FGSG_12624 [Fusarium graminearum PH-1]|uniref:Chromosome 3, complete genome n=1 Tax=Gibberella zeae (strain ATCC MYA-4620 / CBS 123657 / FGSC 9075 / NRRL 31084 / PH-1) TaxID=229533 RepID=I1S701_GIBZE|nr:hypothetical protein FGSG_12624 [Fusarium graminearum PH-1]ESU10709.1 hypothetical protein FGSG_12624 [Fusarium graminearum PH-1]CEF87403.1 unnamed protein product [Fusarium graminearum]|eukprot:XP_011323285.1 hypothetical protein FGSG_12624 [Fusarium graminearum PH-1]